MRYILLTIIVICLATSCTTQEGAASNPEVVVRSQFEQTINNPYQNLSISTVSNDGDFATIRLLVETRHNSNESWIEYSDDIDCRNVGGSWRCNSVFLIISNRQEVLWQSETQTAIDAEASVTQNVVVDFDSFNFDGEILSIYYRVTNNNSFALEVCVPVTVDYIHTNGDVVELSADNLLCENMPFGQQPFNLVQAASAINLVNSTDYAGGYSLSSWFSAMQPINPHIISSAYGRTAGIQIRYP